MKRPHFALPEIYDDSLSYYEVLKKLIKSMRVIDDNLNKIPEQIANEAKAREQGDTALRNDLTTETNAREQGDTALQQKINTEVSAREQADNELRELIRTISGGVIGVTEEQLNEEITARQNADNTLQANIDNEKRSREQADTALQTNIANVNKQFGNIKFVYQTNVPVHFTSSRKSDALTPPENAVAILSVNGEPPWQAWTYAFYNNQFKIVCVDNIRFDRSFNMNILWACRSGF